MSSRSLIAVAIVVGVLLLAGGTALAWDGEDMPEEKPARDATYPEVAEFIPAASFRRGPAARDVRQLVIHITDGAGNARATAEYFASGAEGRNVSAHYVVGRDGAVYQCVADDDIAYHAHTANSYSIGIENSARTPGELGQGDPGLEVTEENYYATARLCHWLCAKYGLAPNRSTIVGHNEADPSTTHTRCPDGAWDWDRFVAVLEETAP